MPSPQQFIADQSLCLLTVLHFWMQPEEITDDMHEFLHAITASMSDEDFGYVETCFYI